MAKDVKDGVSGKVTPPPSRDVYLTPGADPIARRYDGPRFGAGDSTKPIRSPDKGTAKKAGGGAMPNWSA